LHVYETAIQPWNNLWTPLCDSVTCCDAVLTLSSLPRRRI
jgi:hypothetical protein